VIVAPESSLLVGLVLIAAALAALAVSLDFGTSTRSTIRARLRGAGTPKASSRVEKEKKKKGSLFVQDEQLGKLRYLIRPSGLRKLERNLQLAGRASTWSLSSLVLLKVLVPAALFFPLLMWVRSSPGLLHSIMFIAALGICYALPDIVVRGRAAERQASILYELPDVLDQVTISIESGLGFEAALARVGANSKGPLGGEIARVVQDSRLGMSRRDAYQALSDRTDVDDLKRFLKAIVQAEEFGVSISKVVRTQTQELRTKRRQRAEEKAAKVALKLLFPMLACMFPVLFILILTPAIVNMGKVL
jgi:tight adherence protein C